MNLGRILAALTLFASIAYSCALCALYTPTAHAEIKFDADENELKTATVIWTFSENFTELTLQGYDENADKQLNEKESWNIQKALLDYIVPRGYLTGVSYYDDGGETQNLFVKTQSQRVFLNEGRLNFEYVLELNLKSLNKRVVVFEIIDREGFFNFKIANSQPFKINQILYMIPNSNLNAVFFEMSDKKPKDFNLDKPELSSLIKSQSEKFAQIDKIDEEKFDAVSRMSLKFLDDLKALMKSNSQNLELSKFALMMLVSFIYGFLHAAGPGHGKLLTASFFAANGGSYIKAFVFSLKIGVLHVAGALFLVFSATSLLESFATRVANDAASVTTKISALIIVAIALYMLFDKFKNLRPKSHDYKFSVHESSCGCAACQSETKPSGAKEWFVALAAALVPCPGTILVFVLAFSLGSVMIGLASGFFMALGMSAVIFIAAIFGSKMNAASRFGNFKIYFEILALLVMISLGIFMFMISDRVSVL